MDRHDRSSEHEGRTCGASKRAYRQGARRPGLESALRRAWRNALGNLAGRDQGIPRQRGSAAVADHEGGRDQAGVSGLRRKTGLLLASERSSSTNHADQIPGARTVRNRLWRKLKPALTVSCVAIERPHHPNPRKHQPAAAALRGLDPVLALGLPALL